MHVIRRDRALALLSECTGDDIWSVEHCRARRVPEPWIEELADAFESSFDSDSQTIYHEGRTTNQYYGIRDVDLARRLAPVLGIQLGPLEAVAMSRADLVRAIKDAVLEG